MAFSSSRMLPGQAVTRAALAWPPAANLAWASSPGGGVFLGEMRGQQAECPRRAALQRRQVDLDHVEPIKQVLAERALLDQSLPGNDSVAATDADVDVESIPRPADPFEAALLRERAAAWPAWSAGTSPTSSRKMVPPLAISKRPLALAHGAGESALFRGRTARSPATFSGRAAQLTATSGPVRFAGQPGGWPGPPAPCPCRSRLRSAPWKSCLPVRPDQLRNTANILALLLSDDLLKWKVR